MDTISATILEIRNDYENVFHITLEVQIPEGVALIRVDPATLGKDPVINLRSRQPTEPLQLIVTTIGDPALKIGDILAIQVFYDNEVVQRDGRTVPFSEVSSSEERVSVRCFTP